MSRAKKCISRHDFGTVLVVFPILKQLRALKPEFERTVEECDLNVKAKFDAILGMLHSTVGRHVFAAYSMNVIFFKGFKSFGGFY